MELTALKARLEALGYRASVFESTEAACDYMEKAVGGRTVAIGGSVTVQRMQLAERLRKKGRVIWHWEPEEGESAASLLHEARTAPLYISSVNAIAKSGEIVNIDGTCNRLSSILYGHETVFLLVGRNKITEDMASAIDRARNVAAPKNAMRLGRHTPCVTAGKCMDCSSPERICRALSVLYSAPRGADYEVILIDADLGY